MKYQHQSFSISMFALPQNYGLACIDAGHIPSGPDSRRVCLRCGERIVSFIAFGERVEVIKNGY